MRWKRFVTVRVYFVIGAGGFLVSAVILMQAITPDKDPVFEMRPAFDPGLAEWVNQEIHRFELEYGSEVCGPGIIILIEEQLSVPDSVVKWSADNVESIRKVVFQGEHNEFVYHKGRPYCLSRGKPYFVESIAVPPSIAVGFGLLKDKEMESCWICFLTTDGYFDSAFDQQYGNSNCDLQSWLGVVANWDIRRHQFDIDHKLMKLQRREALWSAIIQGCNSKAVSTVLLKELRNRIDYEFGKIFLSQRGL